MKNIGHMMMTARFLAAFLLISLVMDCVKKQARINGENEL